MLKALYNFVTKRIGEVREAAAMAQSTADKAQSTADKAQTDLDKLAAALKLSTVTSANRVSVAGDAVYPVALKVGISAFANIAITSAVFPLCTEVEEYAFNRCQKLTSVDFPELPTINQFTFAYTYALTNVSFPKVTHIRKCAFSRSGIQTAVFDSLTSTDDASFQGSSLTALVIKTASVCSLYAISTLANTPIASGTGYIYVPDALVDSYKAATNWSTYAAQIKPLSEYTGG